MVLWVPWLELSTSLPRPLLLTARCQVGLGIPVGFFTHLGLAGHSHPPDPVSLGLVLPPSLPSSHPTMASSCFLQMSEKLP